MCLCMMYALSLSYASTGQTNAACDFSRVKLNNDNVIFQIEIILIQKKEKKNIYILMLILAT